jgi:nitrogen fixation protein NifB
MLPEIMEQRSTVLLPVAPACNLACTFCPGPVPGEGGRPFRSAALSPGDAVQKVADAVERGDDVRNVILGGPGEPLLNAAAYIVPRRLAWNYPELPVTVCTNGLLLSDRLDQLVRTGVQGVVLSMSAMIPQTAARIYEAASYRARRYSGEAAAMLVLQQQWSGLLNAVEAGLKVTVFAARIFGVNEQEIPLLAERARDFGVDRVITADLVQDVLS